MKLNKYLLFKNMLSTSTQVFYVFASGIAKIKGDKWGGGKESIFYLNIEITKSGTRTSRRDEF